MKVAEKVAELDSETPAVYPTPGLQLKTAREKMGLSIDELAGQSYIPAAKLAALENDQYEKLPSPIFVQGYLRKVSPLLKLDSDKIVTCYHDYLREMQDTVDQVMQPEEIAPAPAAIPPKWIVSGALTGMAVLALVAIYIFVGDEAELPPTQTSELIAVDSEVNEPDATVADNGSDADVIASEEINAPDDADIAAIAVDGAPATPAMPAISGTNVAGAGSREQLAFGFIEECWVEVQNANGETIHAALHTAGEPLIVEGEAPFTVMLGNARAVSIVKNGEPVAIDIPPGHRTARLTIE